LTPHFFIAVGLALLAQCAYASDAVRKVPTDKVVLKKPKKATPVANVSTVYIAPLIAEQTGKKLEVGTVTGSQTISDIAFGKVRTEEVTVTESVPELTAYSSGDVVGSDGQVLQVRMGEVVVMTKSKQGFWKLPLQADASGEAIIVTTTNPELDEGHVVWKTVAAGAGKIEVQAKIAYYRRLKVLHYDVLSYLVGTWLGTYVQGQPLPVSYVVNARSNGAYGSVNNIATELTLLR